MRIKTGSMGWGKSTKANRQKSQALAKMQHDAHHGKPMHNKKAGIIAGNIGGVNEQGWHNGNAGNG